jgi:xylose isomerase
VIGLWRSRAASPLCERKNIRKCFDYLLQALDKMLAYDKRIRIAIEPKPDKPMDVAYIPTIGHALALSSLTANTTRVGCLIESAHAILAGLDPADEIVFACTFRKLWSIDLNNQNGLKFDQDKAFGSANLRVAFNQVRALERNSGFVAFDVQPIRLIGTGHPRYVQGAAISCSADAFAYAGAQVKKAPEVTRDLGGEGYVFWAGREGYFLHYHERAACVPVRKAPR